MQNKVSGKPDAAEFTGRAVALYKSAHDGVSGLDYVEMSEAALERLLADFQRETLLWVKEDCVACAEIEMGHDSVLAARIANRLRTVLERLAESCGRGK